MKRALILAYNFPPMGGGGVQRSVKFVKYLPEFGWDPVVIAADDRRYWARDETLLGDIPPRTDVTRLSPTAPHVFYSLIARVISDRVAHRVLDNLFIPDDRVFWAVRAALGALRFVKKKGIRLVYTTSPPHSAHLAGLILKRITGLPWVADFRDPWTGDFRYDPPTRWVRRMHTVCESKFLSSSDRVVCITESARRAYIEDFGVDPKRLVTIYNGFDPSDFTVVVRREKKESDRIVITHSGSFYGTYFPRTFFRAMAAALEKDPDLKRRLMLRFVGVMDETIRHQIGALLPDHAVFDGYVNHREAVRAVMESDINLIALPAGHEISYHVPGKLFEYLAAGRPVLAVCPRGETASIVESTGVGITVWREEVDRLADDLIDAVRRLVDMAVSQEREDVNGFNRRRLAGMLSEVFDTAAGG